MMADRITKESVLNALSKVQEPELRKDLVTLNMIGDLEIKGDQVSFTIILTTPACPLKGRIENEARGAVLALPGVKNVRIKMDSSVPNDGRSRGLMQLPIRNAVAIASGKGGVGKSTRGECCRYWLMGAGDYDNIYGFLTTWGSTYHHHLENARLSHAKGCAGSGETDQH
jgi:metal-sulfur cluster biosynthetic enzyme